MMEHKLVILDEGSPRHHLPLPLVLTDAEAHGLKQGDILHFRSEEGDYATAGVYTVKIVTITKLLDTNQEGITGMIVMAALMDWSSIKRPPPRDESMGGLLDSAPLIDLAGLNISHYRREQDR